MFFAASRWVIFLSRARFNQSSQSRSSCLISIRSILQPCYMILGSIGVLGWLGKSINLVDGEYQNLTG